MAAIDAIEEIICDEFAGRITRAEAIAEVREHLGVTEAGALDLLTHPMGPRARYQVDGFRDLGRWEQ